ncbi:hypothetical protein [Gordonia malaquae]|uniref:hypothetical protein n=1 Tax=Gordonia malaquae TaxID=410332 RepID=UPI00301B2498
MTVETAAEVRGRIIDAHSRGLFRDATFATLAQISSDDAATISTLLDRVESALLEFPAMPCGFDPLTYGQQDFQAQERLCARIGFAFTGDDDSGDWVRGDLDDALCVRRVQLDSVDDIATIALGGLAWYLQQGISVNRLVNGNYPGGRGFPDVGGRR